MYGEFAMCPQEYQGAAALFLEKGRCSALFLYRGSRSFASLASWDDIYGRQLAARHCPVGYLGSFLSQFLTSSSVESCVSGVEWSGRVIASDEPG